MQAQRITWERHGTQMPLENPGVLTPRKWQGESYELLKDNRLRIINVPTGAGKTLGISMLAMNDLSRGKRIIVAVPTLDIGLGFGKPCSFFLPGQTEPTNWLVLPQNNLVESEKNVEQGSIRDKMLSFLRATSKISQAAPCNAILLCSHAALVNLHSHLQDTKQTSLLRRVSIFVDEAHHSLFTGTKICDAIPMNELGKLMKSVSNRTSCSLTLTTATFFRGDRKRIVPQELRDKFARFDLSYDDHIRDNLQHLEEFTFNYLFYDENPYEALREAFRDRVGKAIVHIPHVANSYYKIAGSDKHKEVAAVLKAVSPRSKWKKNNHGMQECTRGGKTIIAVDLVDDSATRRNRVKYISNHTSSLDGPDIIVALGLFKEGSDYPPLDRSFIVGPRGSLNEVIQIVGRLFRDFKGKRSVEVNYVLPSLRLEMGGEEAKEKANDYLKAVVMSMLLVDVLEPALSPKRKDKPDDEREKYEEQITLRDIADENQACCVLAVVQKAVLSNSDWDQLSSDGKIQMFGSYLENALKVHDIQISDPEKFEDVRDNVWRILARSERTQTDTSKMDVSSVSIDLLTVDPKAALEKFLSKALGDSVFQEFKKQLQTELKQPAEWVPIAEKLAEENGGKLPNMARLVLEMGLCGLAQAIQKHPQLFEHIEQERKKKLLEEHVADAERLAVKNGGELYCVQYLKNNGHNGLIQVMKHYPGAFDHIKQEWKGGNDLKESVNLADRLAKDNDGFFYTQKECSELGHSGLWMMRNKFPDAFAHLPLRNKNNKQVEEHRLLEAKQLADNNNGILPTTVELKSQGKFALISYMQRNPELFVDIPRERLKKQSIEEWVPEAEELAKKHDGLPATTWMKVNGYSGLIFALGKRPELFSHIPRPFKPIGEEAVIILAERLAEENGGLLPVPTKLKKDGHGAVVRLIYKKPDLLAHIPREGRRVDPNSTRTRRKK